MTALPPKLAELADLLGETRRATFDLVSGLSEEEFGRREAGEWSVGDILEHLLHERDHQLQIAGILRASGK
ncbi:MAG: hypothetical protein ACM3NF_02450 [Gemmatimonadota bacterium]